MNARCPVHRQKLENGSCPVCGWRLPEESSAVEEGSGYASPPRDPRCSLEVDELRCPLPATNYPGKRLVHGYCPAHETVESRERPWAELRAELERFHVDARAIYEEMRDETWPRERDRLIRQVADAHPEWVRQPGETQRDFAVRMLGTAHELGKGIRSRFIHEESEQSET